MPHIKMFLNQIHTRACIHTHTPTHQKKLEIGSRQADSDFDLTSCLKLSICSSGVHMANAAKRFPEATFQMGHFTITDWQYQLKAIAPYPNIYTDMSGSAYDSPQMEEAVEMLGADRILFATDGSVVACAGKILGANISVEDKKTILAGKAFERFIEKAGR